MRCEVSTSILAAVSSFAFNWKFPLEEPSETLAHNRRKKRNRRKRRFQIDKREAAFCQDLRGGECVYIKRERENGNFRESPGCNLINARRSLFEGGRGAWRKENGLFDCKGREWSVAVGQFVRLSNCAQIAVSLFSFIWGQTDKTD